MLAIDFAHPSRAKPDGVEQSAPLLVGSHEGAVLPIARVRV